MPMRLIPTREFALYQLDAAGAQDAAHCPEPFEAERHSSYKYGSTAAAEWFGQRLAAGYLARDPHAMGWPRVLIASSPYHLVPTAAAALARGFRTAFNSARTAATGLAAAPLVQIERTVTTTAHYGALSPAAREERIAAESISFGRLARHDLRGTHLIVVDDVKTTGAQQRSLVRASRELPLGSRTFLYTAVVAPVQPATGSGPDSGALWDPTVADRLDHARIRTLEDFTGMLRERVGDFAWNVEVCEFLLSPQRRDELPGFLGRAPGRFIRELHRHSLADGYATMPAFRDSFALINAELRRREVGASEEVRSITSAPLSRRHLGARSGSGSPVLAAAAPARRSA